MGFVTKGQARSGGRHIGQFYTVWYVTIRKAYEDDEGQWQNMAFLGSEERLTAGGAPQHVFEIVVSRNNKE